MTLPRWLPAAFALALISPPVTAADWPQWLGPDRNGVGQDAGLLRAWPKGGPKLRWKAVGLGDGFSAPAVVAGKVYVLGSVADAKVGDPELLFVLDEKSGNKLGSLKFGSVGANTGGPFYPGPRGTPTVEGEHLYALASGGELACLALPRREVVWTRKLISDFGGKPGGWAYAESPLVDGDLVVVSPGGKTATVVGLNKKTGEPVWKCPVPGADHAGFGSPIRIEVGGVKQYVVFLSGGLVGVRADGMYLWRFKEPTNTTANIPTPLFHDGLVFGVSGYSAGGGVCRVSADKTSVKATPGWHSAELTSQIGGFVRVGDFLYGAGAGGHLMCVEFATGKERWNNAGVGSASLCAADGLLFVRGHNGTIALVEAAPDGYKEHGRFKQPERSKKPAWPYPVVANGGLYLRDMDVLLCYDVSDPKAKK
jgi:outer membrane protein assembly factor BamB